jgi:hypothetical protein
MAALPGQKISISDLAALAGQANGKSSLSKNVSPLYNDGSGQPYGYKTFSGVAVDPLHPGTGYKVGDALTLGFSSIFAVAQVSATGAVLGIRVVNGGQGQYNDPTWNGTTGTQIANGGGSGTGCQLLNSFAHYGPTANYAFPDFSPTDGVITGFYLVDGGTGYTNGNTLTVDYALWTTSVLTVASVDGAGKILTFTLATLGSPVLPATVPQNVASVAAAGGTGSGAKVGAYFTLNANPCWLAELNRLRGSASAAASYYSGDILESTSGPWPVAGPAINYRWNTFYFEDTGSEVDLTITTHNTTYISGKMSSYYPISYISGDGTKVILPLEGDYYYGYDPNVVEFDLVIGGTAPVMVTGVISVSLVYFLGFHYDSRSGAGALGYSNVIDAPPTPTITSPLGTAVLLEPFTSSGPDFSYFNTPYVKQCAVAITINQEVSPGTYHFRIETQNSGELGSYTAVPGNPLAVVADRNSMLIIVGLIQGNQGVTIASNGDFGFYGTMTASKTINSGAVQTAGIDGTKNVWKLALDSDANGNNAILGFLNWVPCQWSNSPPADYPSGWSPTYITPPKTTMWPWTLSTLPPGFWTAVCPMVSNLHVVTPPMMPWNQQRTKYGISGNATVNPSLLGDLAANIANVAKISNSYDQSLPVELQAEPPSWIASRYFSIGFTIMDSNGNLQLVTHAGTSGGSAPAWSQALSGATTDGTAIWTCQKVFVPAVTVSEWLPGHTRLLGDTLIDSNGNLQTISTAGAGGYSAPIWTLVDGGLTTDGSAIWKMTRLLHLTPAIHRPQSIPVYPFYWQGDSTLPTTWVAATAYALNATVIDANGNTQKCTTAGTSAGTAPVWSQTLAGVTSDGSTLKWTLLTLAAETNAFLKPPTATSGLTRWGANNQWQRNTYHSPSYDAGWQQDNLAFGWWIYSVSLNRINAVLKTVNGIGAGDAGIGAGDTGVDASGVSGSEVNVTIGCMRNGAFVAFGTWATGQTIQVLWPVFTSDALVYQCGERIDLQAVAISSGGAGVSVGATAAGYPMCAAFVSDTTQLLNLIT